MITLSTLKQKGFHLTKEQAQEIHPLISQIAQHGDGNVYAPGNGVDAPDYLKEYYREVAEKNIVLQAENDKLKDDISRTVGNYEYHVRIQELEKENEELKANITKLLDFQQGNSQKVLITEYDPSENTDISKAGLAKEMIQIANDNITPAKRQYNRRK